jgi:hypothetical protein
MAWVLFDVKFNDVRYAFAAKLEKEINIFRAFDFLFSAITSYGPRYILLSIMLKRSSIRF